jgi:two-component system response regulator DctR
MRTVRVLVVEDDETVGEINREFTERLEGFAVIGVARSVAAALEAAERLQPDLVLLDVYMPDGDGVELLKEIRRREVDVDVIPVTAARSAGVVRQLLRHGAVGYVMKPFKFERFSAVMLAYRRWRASMDGDVALSQAEVDRLHRLLASSHQEELPKGLDQLTLQSIVDLLERRRDYLTAEEVAEEVGASRVTARRYLEYLAESGQAEVKLSYGAVGRPVRRYQLVSLEPGEGAGQDGEG